MAIEPIERMKAQKASIVETVHSKTGNYPSALFLVIHNGLIDYLDTADQLGFYSNYPMFCLTTVKDAMRLVGLMNESNAGVYKDIFAEYVTYFDGFVDDQY